ncbi:hypothetical protein [Streptomyces sp. NPDC017529]
MRGLRMEILADDGKHAGPPSDKPWTPPPDPPSPDGNGKVLMDEELNL